MRLALVAPDSDLRARLVGLLTALDGGAEEMRVEAAAPDMSPTDPAPDVLVVARAEPDGRSCRSAAASARQPRPPAVSFGSPLAQTAHDARTRWPGVRLVLALASTDLSHALPALQHGYDSVAVVDGAVELALRSLRAAVTGALWWPPGGVHALRQHLRAAPDARHVSPRERDVLMLLAHGWSQPEIAARLGVSITTVSTHVQRLYRKLEVKTAPAAVLAGVRLGLVRP